MRYKICYSTKQRHCGRSFRYMCFVLTALLLLHQLLYAHFPDIFQIMIPQALESLAQSLENSDSFAEAVQAISQEFTNAG